MSSDLPLPDEQFVDLLIQRSTTGLSQHEQQEFEKLAHSHRNPSEAQQYELTVAALDLSFGCWNREVMPRDVQDRLLLAAGKYFGNGREYSYGPMPRSSKVELSSRRSASPFNWRESIALAITAACIMLMLSGWNPFADRIPTAAERIQHLNDSPPRDLVRVKWTPKDAENAASGSVVWSDSKQEGYMEFVGMPHNDPQVKQYQLWIFDTDTDEKHPVDGGVFDIDASGKGVIPINPHNPVNKAVLFAVTLEKPGGVVVSERESIQVLAAR